MAEVQSRESVLSVTGELTGTLASLHSDAQARDTPSLWRAISIKFLELIRR